MKFYSHTTEDGVKEVIAVSHYRGRPVRGIAKCNPEDNFDEEVGKQLAEARCNQKIAAKKLKRASAKYLEAAKAADVAEINYQYMKQYYIDSFDNLTNANGQVDEILTKINKVD